MSISRKTQEPVGITNASGQPEIVLELRGLTLSMKPPSAAGETAEASETEPAGELGDE